MIVLLCILRTKFNFLVSWHLVNIVSFFIYKPQNVIIKYLFVICSKRMLISFLIVPITYLSKSYWLQISSWRCITNFLEEASIPGRQMIYTCSIWDMISRFLHSTVNNDLCTCHRINLIFQILIFQNFLATNPSKCKRTYSISISVTSMHQWHTIVRWTRIEIKIII